MSCKSEVDNKYHSLQHEIRYKLLQTCCVTNYNSNVFLTDHFLLTNANYHDYFVWRNLT